MENFDFKIGLAFSGGGFRASSFGLGVITILNSIKTTDELTLLDKITALSTVSGGTITGARYALGIKQNESLEQIYGALYAFMTEVDVVNMSLDRLSATYNWNNGRNQNLINAFADIYEKELFRSAQFGVLLNNDPPIHLKHISFNATEFSNALQFRFQVSEKTINPLPGVPDRGIIGNHYYQIPFDIAKEIRMSDILAASSCFPGGFEPINFPNDFGIELTSELKNQSVDGKFPVGLMDGGIVDNQGIEPLLLANDRMKKNNLNPNPDEKDTPELDLLIISDVASPYMESYIASQQKEAKGIKKQTPKSLFIINIAVLLITIIALVLSILFSNLPLVILSTILVTLSGVTFLIAWIIRSIPGKVHVPPMFVEPLGKLLKIRLSVYENLMVNRVDSLLKLSGEVFLKHIRRLNYATIFNNPKWQNRRIMNAIYELRTKEKGWIEKIQKGSLPKNLAPSSLIQETAEFAASMPTTLWFTGDISEKRETLNKIIATGQFTACWNLLEYIYKLKTNQINTNNKHLEFIKLENQLQEHWEKFQSDPLWLVNELNIKSGI